MQSTVTGHFPGDVVEHNNGNNQLREIEKTHKRIP